MSNSDLGRYTRVDHPRGIAFFATEPSNHVTPQLVALLESEAIENQCNVRLCLHTSPDDAYHDMIIVERQGEFLAPHRHPQKAETIQVIRGELSVSLYDDDGTKTDEFLLFPLMVCRIGANVFHAVRTLSPISVYHESKLGPFLGDADRQFAVWEE